MTVRSPFTRSVVVLTLAAMAIGHLAGCASDSSAANQQSETQAERVPQANANAQTSPTDTDGGDRHEVSAKELLLDRQDLDRLNQTLLEQYESSELASTWAQQTDSGNRPLLIFAPFANETDAPVGASIDAIVMKLETQLVNRPESGVISPENASELVAVAFQQEPDSELDALALFGKQAKADYVVTGRVSSDAKPEPPTRRVTYTVQMYVLDVDTKAIVHETTTTVTKPN
ncbi:hypothetical protein FIV42_22690 [Persicimonas caeni]|uniref:Penicillin-binding protein activator LpoB n=1 Tax=Persicimonas caeni TaxID=2292766 RepID=A0A4Y6PYQ2_PERCE|nr:hypothetical protein [Persicimonas caeni]QDG53448.1 hypothetical protein FIV42_22690 [Persicimonas caeni]QED34669.1 hypothetical protein FRD00_22685 [Persicimonas caeni]